jgi:hypothetical protein
MMSSKKGDNMIKIQHLCMALSVLALSVSAWSMEALTIEQVYSQYNGAATALDAAAIKVIDDFWRKSLDVMMLSEDTDKIVELRLELKKYNGSNHLSFYASSYQKAAKEHLKVAIDTVGKWEEGVKRARVERNIMILIAEIGSVGLVDLALPQLSSKDPMVRYWAVRSLTSKDIVEQSAPAAVTRDENRTARIIAGLDSYLKATPDIVTIPLITLFASEINTAASRKMLAGLADRRIDAYMKWTITDEQIDADILKSLGNAGVQAVDPAERQELLSRFGQLYACVLGRFMQTDKIPAGSRERLISVIVEVEDKFFINSKYVPGWAPRFKTDINTNKPLNDAYNLLFGSNNITGELAAKLKFNYGKDSAGKPLLVPRPLPAPPAAAVEVPSPAVPAAKP